MMPGLKAAKFYGWSSFDDECGEATGVTGHLFDLKITFYALFASFCFL
jgi:hypothetical protein